MTFITFHLFSEFIVSLVKFLGLLNCKPLKVIDYLKKQYSVIKL